MIGTILLLITAATALGINQARVQYNQAKEAGRYAHHAGLAREGIRRVEGNRVRRKLIARAQLMGAAAGSGVGDPTLGQLGADIDRQTELDVWGIREETWRQRFAARQAIQAAKNQAIQSGMSGLSQGLTAGMGGGITQGTLSGGAGYGSSLGSSYVGTGSGSYRLRAGTDYRAGYGDF